MQKAYAVLAVFLAVAFAPIGGVRAEERPRVSSGETQVVAKAGAREITISEIRLEMASLGLDANDPAAERTAIDRVVNRVLLAEAARKARMPRQPAVMARMQTAVDAALADYFLAATATPPEPTRAEIDAYVAANPSLFAGAALYDFEILTLATVDFDEETMTGLFDETADFSAFRAALDEAGVDYDLSPARNHSSAFPAPVREQLHKYGPRDNIVIKGAVATQVMKIRRKRSDPLPQSEWGAMARRFILEAEAERRSENLIERLRRDAGVEIYRKSAQADGAKGGGDGSP